MRNKYFTLAMAAMALVASASSQAASSSCRTEATCTTKTPVPANSKHIVSLQLSGLGSKGCSFRFFDTKTNYTLGYQTDVYSVNHPFAGNYSTYAVTITGSRGSPCAATVHN